MNRDIRSVYKMWKQRQMNWEKYRATGQPCLQGWGRESQGEFRVESVSGCKGQQKRIL